MNYDDRYYRDDRSRGRSDGYRYDPYSDYPGEEQGREPWPVDEDLPWFNERSGEKSRQEQPQYRESRGQSRYREPANQREDRYRESASQREDRYRESAWQREDRYRETPRTREPAYREEESRPRKQQRQRPRPQPQPQPRTTDRVPSGKRVGGGGKKPPQRKRRSFLRTFLFLVLLIILGALIGGAIYFHGVISNVNFIDNEDGQEANIKKVDRVTNILLVGEDARGDQEGGGQRTDSIILATINPDTREVILTSFMRDMYVPIPGHKKNRINTAFSMGGISLLEETIEKDFDVRIDGYIGIDFAGFLKVIAMMDRVQIDLTEEEAAYMNEHPEYGSEIDWTTDVWNLQPGLNTLTPEQLLAYSRMRHVGNSDWERTERQRKVLTLIYDQFKSASVPKLLSMLRNVAPCITTDVQLADLLSYAYLAAGDGIQTIESNRIPADGTFKLQNVNGMDVIVPDLEANARILQEYINNERSNDAAEELSGEEAEDHMGVMETET